jgi:transcriptional regulator with GAF, ATPase, and Fis domain
MADYGRPWSPLGPSSERPDPRGAPSELELRQLLERHQGNVAAVGRILGKARMQIHRWVARYNIDLAEYR